MDIDLRPLVSCHFYIAIIRQRKKDFGEIEKIKKYNQRMFMLELRITLFFCMSVCVCVCESVCLCRLYLRIVVCGRIVIVSMCLCVYDR